MGNCIVAGAKHQPIKKTRDNKQDDLKSRRRPSEFDNLPSSMGMIVEPNLKEFKYATLKKATRDFRPDTILGEGGFGRVFKGWLDENTYAPSKAGFGMAVTVKKSSSDSFQGEQELEDYNAKLSDFGLAKLGPLNGDSHVTTSIVGTYGYTAPEYFSTGHLYVKSDVYGFGVVLLEMLTGRRALDTNRPAGEHKLVDWARLRLLKKKGLKKIMDPKLEDEYNLKGACQSVQLIYQCLESEPKDRPSMEEVSVVLERVNAIQDKPKGAKIKLKSQEGSSRQNYNSQNKSSIHERDVGNGVTYQARAR